MTASDGRSRLYRLTFTDITHPEQGGVVSCLLDGTEGGEMFDNLCVDSHGRVIIQEDVGNNVRLGRIWLYDIASASFTQVAAHDPAHLPERRRHLPDPGRGVVGRDRCREQLGDGLVPVRRAGALLDPR